VIARTSIALHVLGQAMAGSVAREELRRMEVTAGAAGFRGGRRHSASAADHGAAELAGLYPDLVRCARAELFTRHLDVQLAEDLVSDATIRWLTSARIQYISARSAKAWFRVTIRRMAVDRLRRPGRDILDQVGVYSLDEPWSRGE
jgi:DNA-directed RNA polymerase specialized sigma24 family protein